MADKRQLPSLIELDRAIASRSLAGFVRAAWHVVEPSERLYWGWALDAICAHLEAVTRGEITRLLINVPPGMCKSLLLNVFWPAWEWGPQNQPHHRYLGTAHKLDLSIRDSTKCRRLIQSDWYQARWPVKITSDQNSKLKFENTQTGFRESMSFVSLTGSRGSRLLIDDPLSVDDAASDAARLAVEQTFLEAVPTRVNNRSSAIVMIMQRLHERDPSGLILSMGLPYTHLCLPMRFDPSRRCSTSIGFTDPRTADGELLFPERFDEVVVSELEQSLLAYGTAGQLQQLPAPRRGGIFQREWLATVADVPRGTRFVRGWDLAATAGAGDWTVGVKIGRTPDGRYVITDVVRGQWSPAGVERAIIATAQADGHDCAISIPQDPGQAGKAQVGYLVGQLAGYNVTCSTESGDKVTRAMPLAAQAEVGNVSILTGDWNRQFIDELAMFPNGKKDQVDAASRAFTHLTSSRIFDMAALL